VEFPSESGTPDLNDASSQWEQSNLLMGTTDTPYSSTSQGALVSASGSLLSRTNWEQGTSKLHENLSSLFDCESVNHISNKCWDNKLASIMCKADRNLLYFMIS